MSVVITGATGQLGGLVIDDLLDGGADAAGITAAGRSSERLAELATKGVTTAQIDYEDPASLRVALRGAETLLLISGNEVGSRVGQHGNAVQTAAQAGVGHIVYTSVLRATATALVLAPEHKATEEIIADSGLTATILRNGWYNENSARHFPQARETGVIIGSAGQGRTASAARADYAAAAAAVLRDPAAHAGRTYELGGDTAWTNAELAEVLSEVLGREVVYRDLSPAEHREALLSAGLNAGAADFAVGLEGNIRDGELEVTTGDLSRLIGRPPPPLIDPLRSLA
jgi:NAD(P)H dehydrogenase (quinone)